MSAPFCHSEPKAKNPYPRPWLPQGPYERRNAFRRERTSKGAERVFTVRRKQSEVDFARTMSRPTQRRTTSHSRHSEAIGRRIRHSRPLPVTQNDGENGFFASLRMTVGRGTWFRIHKAGGRRPPLRKRKSPRAGAACGRPPGLLLYLPSFCEDEGKPLVLCQKYDILLGIYGPAGGAAEHKG